MDGTLSIKFHDKAAQTLVRDGDDWVGKSGFSGPIRLTRALTGASSTLTGAKRPT